MKSEPCYPNVTRRLLDSFLGRCLLRLLKIHRILIGSGIALCLLFTLLQCMQYLHTQDLRALLRAGIAAVLALALGRYFRSLRALNN